MNVEISVDPHIATRMGAGVPYALKVLARQLADDPDLGRPSNLPGVRDVTVDGDPFEDCPDLAVGYIREPDRIEIRFVKPISAAKPNVGGGVGAGAGQGIAADSGTAVQDREQQGRPADHVTDAVTVRQVRDAWRRITTWLRHNAPASYAGLRAGADAAAIAALESDLGVRIPVELRTLWLLTRGDDGGKDEGDGYWGCLPGNQVLMPLDEVADFYRQQMDAQAYEDTFNIHGSEEDRITMWKGTWIPVVRLGVNDRTSGLYLDTETGFLGRWSRYREAPDEELDTLVTYLEEAADMLEAPALATRDKPGLIGGVLVWANGVPPVLEDRWQSLSG